MMERSPCFVTVFLFLAPFVWAWPVQATTVAVVRPLHLSSEVTETVSRIHGELLSLGLAVALVDHPTSLAPAAADTPGWVAQVAAESGAVAVIDIVGEGSLVAADVWIGKSPLRRFEVTRIAAEPNTGNPSERLALRAIEALRAGLHEIELAARQEGDQAVSKPAKTTVAVAEIGRTANERERFALEVGAAGLMSLDGVGLAILPTVRAGWAARPWLLVEAALAGAGSRPMVTTVVGGASVAQHYGILGTCFRVGPDLRVWPFFGFAAGVLHTSIVGQSGPGMAGHDLDRWSFVLDASAGAGLRLTRRYYVALAAHVQVADPYVAIHIADTVGATTGRPNLVVTLTVGAWL
jgi:hypothetical protein